MLVGGNEWLPPMRDPSITRSRRSLGLWLGGSATLLALLVVGVLGRNRVVAEKRQAEAQTIQALAETARARSFARVGMGSLAADPAISAALLREVALPVPSGWLAAAVAASQRPKAYSILEGHIRTVDMAVFSPDGKKVLTCGDETARVWNTDGSGQPVELKGHTKAITSVAFSPDGNEVLTVSFDRTARVWNTDGTGRPVQLEGQARARSFRWRSALTAARS
jgi:hypothetical protein